MTDTRRIDCLVCGEACIDLAIGPIRRDVPLQEFGLQRVDPILMLTGGIVPNAGAAMARLGLRVAALCVVGNDGWGERLRASLEAEGLDVTSLHVHPTAHTSATAVLIDRDGEHSFAFHAGASQSIDAEFCLRHLDRFAQSRFALFGYYHLLPRLEDRLAEVLAAVRETGCRTALDASNGGGSMEPLTRMLPHLDYYVPSRDEAQQQTGKAEPAEMLNVYRWAGMRGVLGIKLGADGAVLEDRDGRRYEIEPVTPPGPVLDTTGAGDCFYAGLLAGLARGLPLEDAGRLAAAAGACSVTGKGAVGALRNWDETARLASV